MRNLLIAGRTVLLDMASTLFFLVLYLGTHNIRLAVGLGIALGIAQIGWEFVRKRPIDAMQWMSLFLIVASGAATLVTNDPRFVMLKPSVIYVIVGIVMLRPGWMNRYLPSVATEVVPDIAYIFGFVWAGLMFLSAVVNILLALNSSAAMWASAMTVYGIATKLGLFLIQYATMRMIAISRRRRSVLVSAAEVS